MTGTPFDESGKDSALFADFVAKVEALKIEAGRKTELVEEARLALVQVLQPAYGKLIAFLEEQAKRATTEDGVWKFKDGEAYYNEALRLTTTTDLTAMKFIN